LVASAAASIHVSIEIVIVIIRSLVVSIIVSATTTISSIATAAIHAAAAISVVVIAVEASTVLTRHLIIIPIVVVIIRVIVVSVSVELVIIVVSFLLSLLLFFGERTRQAYLERILAQHFALLLFHRLHALFSLLKVYERVVLHFSHALKLSVCLEKLLHFFFGHFGTYIFHIQHFHFGHGLLIGLLVWVGPVDGNLTIKHAIKLAQLSFGHRRRLVINKFEKAKASIFYFVIGGRRRSAWLTSIEYY